MVGYLVNAGPRAGADDKEVMVVVLGRREVGDVVGVPLEDERVAVRALSGKGVELADEPLEGFRDGEEETAVEHPGDHAARRDVEALLELLEVVDEGSGRRREVQVGDHAALEVGDDCQVDVDGWRLRREKGRVGEAVNSVVLVVVHVSCIVE